MRWRECQKMSMFMRVLLFLCVITMVVVGVAPGDDHEALTCPWLRTVGSAPIPGYDPSIRVLMGSWNYLNLVGINRNGAVRQKVDNDENNPSGITTNVRKKIMRVCSCK